MDTVKLAATTAFSTVSTVRKIVTGDFADPTMAPGKLKEFLSSLVLYPAFYIFATSGTSSNINAVAPEAKSKLSDFPEGRALLELERWCREPVYLGLLDELLYKSKDYLYGLLLWADIPRLNNLRLYLAKVGDPPPEHTISEVIDDMLKHGKMPAVPVSTGRVVGPALPAHASVKIEDVTAGNAGLLTGAVLEESILLRVAAAVEPNIAHINRKIEARYSLMRSRTWYEFAQFFLGFARYWFLWLSFAFYSLGAGLRLLGNVLNMVSAALSFTVVFSIAISIISAIVVFSSSAADGTGSTIDFLTRATDVAKRRTSKAKSTMGEAYDIVGPKVLPAATFEELEDLFLQQLAGRLTLRNRPDAGKLANDRLMVRCYDLHLIDSRGHILVHSATEVANRFDTSGFFSLVSPTGRTGAAVLLLQLLAWKRINALVKSGEVLRYVYTMGQPGSGATALFSQLANLSPDYKVPAETVPAEIRMVPSLTNTYAVLMPGLVSSNRHVAQQARRMADFRAGVVSALVYTVSVTDDPLTTDLTPLFEAMRLHKCCLLAINKAIKLVEAIQVNPHCTDEVKSRWQQRVQDEVSLSGLEADSCNIMVTELLDLPPTGCAGIQQVRDWLQQAMAQVQR